MTTKENPDRGESIEACGEQQINTAACQLELDEDGLPPFQSLSEFLSNPLPCTREEVDAEDAEEDSFSPEEWDACRDQVVRNWNEKDRRKIAYADAVLAAAEKYKDKIGGKEKWWLKAQETKGLLEYPSIGCAANDEHPEFVLDEPDQIIKGVLHAGCKLVLGGPSKSYKTWNLTALGFAVATGAKWMNHFECAQRKVLYLNYELAPFVFQQRRTTIREAMGLTTEQVRNFHFWELKGYAGDIADFLPHLMTTVESGNYGLVIIDPIYKIYGDRDENKASDVGAIVNALDQVCTATGAAIAFGAHFPKGDMSARKAMDRIAGSGVFSRDPEVILTISDVNAPKMPDNPADLSIEDSQKIERISTGHFREVELALRNFESPRPLIIEWAFPLFNVSDALEPESIKRIKQMVKTAKQDRKSLDQINAVLDWFRDNPVLVTREDVMKGTEIKSQNTLASITARLEAAGFIERENQRAPWKITGKQGPFSE
jgi:hypothetical protein